MVAARDVHPVRDQRGQLGDRGCAKFRSVLRVSGAGAPDFDLKSRACRTRLGNRARHRRARPSSNQAIAIPAINSRCRRDHRLRTGAARLKPNSRANSDAAHRASDADQKADQPAPRGRPTTKTGSQPLSKNGPPIGVPRRPLFRTVTPYARPRRRASRTIRGPSRYSCRIQIPIRCWRRALPSAMHRNQRLSSALVA